MSTKKKLPGKSGKAKKSSTSRGSTAFPGRRSARSPSVKQRKYVKARLEGKSKTAAAAEAGYAESVGKNAGQKLDSAIAVQQLFTALLETAGITDGLLAQRIREGLDANSVLRETMYADREVLIDFEERREMVELVLKLKGLLIDKHEHRMSRTLEEILEGSHE